MQREMPEDLKKFEAVFAECTGPECKLVTQYSRLRTNKMRLRFPRTLALLEGNELIYLSKC